MILGAHRRMVCTRGHDMSITRKIHPNGDTYCYACKVIRTKAFRKENPKKVAEYGRTSNRRRRYGLEPDVFEELMTEQHGVCAICKTENWGKRGPHIDHCHDSEQIRGLLCHRCNTAIGLLRDSPVIIKEALKYVAMSESGKRKPKGLLG